LEGVVGLQENKQEKLNDGQSLFPFWFHPPAASNRDFLTVSHTSVFPAVREYVRQWIGGLCQPKTKNLFK